MSTDRIPILKLGSSLIVSIQVGLYDRLAVALQNDLAARILETQARAVLIDISAREVVGSYVARVLGNVASVASVLDADTVVVGMQPAVAITLVELGITLPGVRSALNIEKGMALIAPEWGEDGQGENRMDGAAEN